MSFKDPRAYHPQAAKQTLSCEDLTSKHYHLVAYIRGDKFIYFDFSLWLVWDWHAGKLLAVSCFQMTCGATLMFVITSGWLLNIMPITPVPTLKF